MEIDKICSQIKFHLKSNNIKQDEFAAMLGVSTPTMKRWLKGEGLLLKDLGRMLGKLDLKLSEISLVAEGEQESKFTYTIKQEEALSKFEGLLAFFDLLLKGKTPNQIAKTYNLTTKSLSFYLSKLDKLQLILWLPKNRVKLLVQGEPNWIKDGPLSQKFRRQIIEGYLLKYGSDHEQLRVGIYSLTKRSHHLISEIFRETLEKIRLLEIKDSQKTDPKRLTTILLGHGQNEVPILINISNKY